MFRTIALSIAVALFCANTVIAKDRPTPAALERLRTELISLQTDSLVGLNAMVLVQNLAVVQREIEKGNKLLRHRQFHISVISVALNAMQVGDCRGWREREATILDALDKNGIHWIGFPDTIMMPLPDSIRAFPLENGELYSFLDKFRAVPVEHFAPGRYRDIQMLLDVVRAQQHIARTTIVLGMHHATSAVIIGPPMFARTVWRVMQWMASGDLGCYIPIDTGEVFYTNSSSKFSPAIPESLARALWGPPIIDANGLKMYGGIESTPFQFLQVPASADTTRTQPGGRR